MPVLCSICARPVNYQTHVKISNLPLQRSDMFIARTLFHASRFSGSVRERTLNRLYEPLYCLDRNLGNKRNVRNCKQILDSRYLLGYNTCHINFNFYKEVNHESKTSKDNDYPTSNCFIT